MMKSKSGQFLCQRIELGQIIYYVLKHFTSAQMGKDMRANERKCLLLSCEPELAYKIHLCNR